MRKPTTPTYKTLNWPPVEPWGAIGSIPMAREALKRRGCLTIWFDPEMIWAAAPTGKRGRQPVCSGEADQETVRV